MLNCSTISLLENVLHWATIKHKNFILCWWSKTLFQCWWSKRRSCCKRVNDNLQRLFTYTYMITFLHIYKYLFHPKRKRKERDWHIEMNMYKRISTLATRIPQLLSIKIVLSIFHILVFQTFYVFVLRLQFCLFIHILSSFSPPFFSSVFFLFLFSPLYSLPCSGPITAVSTPTIHTLPSPFFFFLEVTAELTVFAIGTLQLCLPEDKLIISPYAFTPSCFCAVIGLYFLLLLFLLLLLLLLLRLLLNPPPVSPLYRFSLYRFLSLTAHDLLQLILIQHPSNTAAVAASSFLLVYLLLDTFSSSAPSSRHFPL